MLLNIIIVGGGKRGTNTLKNCLSIRDIKIIGIIDPNNNCTGFKVAKDNGIMTSNDYTLVEDKNANFIIDTTNNSSAKDIIMQKKNEEAGYIDYSAACLLLKILNQMEQYTKFKKHMDAILDATQEGIQAVDSDGTVLYVNKAFTEILHVPQEKRLGMNIFEISPNGGLVDVLRTGKPVFGKIHNALENDIAVLANASPIIMDKEMIGAVTVFRELSDYSKMADLLKKSKEEINYLKEEINTIASAKFSFNDIIGTNYNLRRCIEISQLASQSSSTVIITGESGTGKELFAHAIHKEGVRAQGPFIKVNCAAIPENLLESELFGYEKGAFTGAYKTKLGKFELANEGTIFLDEIGEMNILLQAKLLRVLQDKEVERIGSNSAKKIDVRVVAATNRNLLECVEKGTFRKDLYYRLNVFSINVPSLKDRKDDIPHLVEHIMKKLNRRYNKTYKLRSDIIDLINNYTWPGNVRELENFLEKIVVLDDMKLIKDNLDILKEEKSDIKTLEDNERQMINKILDLYGHDLKGKKKAADKLNISLSTLYYKLRKYNKMDSEKQYQKFDYNQGTTY